MRLDLDAAPPTALPRAGLLLAACWGLVAGALLLVDGRLATLSRWGPATLALVHALTVGMFGNAATGALQQFLPAAAGVRTLGGPRAGVVLMVLLNAGAVALVAGFRSMRPSLLGPGGVLVAMALSGLAAIALPGLLARWRESLHAGLAAALVALVFTAALGLAMVASLTAHGGLAPARWIDVHAGWGLGGAMVLLIAAVAQQVLPMFQGVAAMPGRAFAAWVVTLGMALLAMLLTRAALPARALLAACIAAWAVSTLWRQLRTRRHRRNAVLVQGWRLACIAMVAAPLAGVLVDARLAGAFALALALPLALVPMLLEITAFLGWLGLYRDIGGRVPGVHALQPERDKAQVVALQVLAGAAVVSAVAWPGDVLARAAGVLLLVAHGALLVALSRLHRRCRRALHEAGR